jgi:hypothetical protein
MTNIVRPACDTQACQQTGELVVSATEFRAIVEGRNPCLSITELDQVARAREGLIPMCAEVAALNHRLLLHMIQSQCKDCAWRLDVLEIAARANEKAIKRAVAVAPARPGASGAIEPGFTHARA